MMASRSQMAGVSLLVAVVLAVALPGCGEERTDPVVGEWVYDKSDDAVNAYVDAMERYVASESPGDEGGESEQLLGQGAIRKALEACGITEFPKTLAERRKLFRDNIKVSKAVIRYEPDGRVLSLKHPGDPNPQVFRWRRKGEVIEILIPDAGDVVFLTAKLEGHRLWVEGAFPGVREAWVRQD